MQADEQKIIDSVTASLQVTPLPENLTPKTVKVEGNDSITDTNISNSAIIFYFMRFTVMNANIITNILGTIIGLGTVIEGVINAQAGQSFNVWHFVTGLCVALVAYFTGKPTQTPKP